MSNQNRIKLSKTNLLGTKTLIQTAKKHLTVRTNHRYKKNKKVIYQI